MAPTPIQDVLNELHFSADMPQEVLKQLAAESSLLCAKAGSVVFREGSPHENLYLVRRGRLALEMKVPGRGAIRILTVGAGEMAGWSGLLGGAKMTATCLAVEESELVVVAAENLRLLSEANHDFGYHLMQQLASALSKRLLATRLQLLDLFADLPSALPVGPAEEGE